MQTTRKKFRGIWYLLVLVAVTGVILITGVDTTDYRDTPFYSSTLNRMDSLKQLLANQGHHPGPVVAGWGKATITPKDPVRLTGKNYQPYQQVFDSVYVRVMLFSAGPKQVVVLNYDLWIIHPNLAQYLRKRIHQEYPKITGIYFTANHSHTSIGGWASGLLGSLVVGGNSPETLEFIGRQSLDAIHQAQTNLSEVTVGFGSIPTEGLVTNRLNDQGIVDSDLRVLKLINERDETAVLNSFSAHSVYMNKDINTLSADYPGPFLEELESMEQITFAAFAPGATGSHTPIGRKPFSRAKMLAYSEKLAGYFSAINPQIQPESTEVLKFAELPVDLRSAHFRISQKLRIRPWVFNTFMGEPNASISVLRLGNVVMVGLPVELSGEYYKEFAEVCKRRGLSLMITSFNGCYLGYVNPYKYYYTLKKAETREMNWYGPQNGEYFVELIKQVLEIV